MDGKEIKEFADKMEGIANIFHPALIALYESHYGRVDPRRPWVVIDRILFALVDEHRMAMMELVTGQMRSITTTATSLMTPLQQIVVAGMLKQASDLVLKNSSKKSN